MRKSLSGAGLLLLAAIVAVSCDNCRPNLFVCEKTSDCPHHHYCSDNKFCIEPALFTAPHLVDLSS